MADKLTQLKALTTVVADTGDIEAIKRYQSRISGPLLDRIDLHIDVPPLKAQELQDSRAVEDSATVRARVIHAFDFQIWRRFFQRLS